MAKSFLLHQLRDLLRRSRLSEREADALATRREFLRRTIELGIAAAALSPTASLLQSCASRPVLSTTDDRVAILGGGIAGLSAAFHLARAGVACDVYEAAPRLGGRMFTHENLGADRQSCELGAEYLDSNHEDLLTLCRFFGIPVDPVDVGTQGLARNLYCIVDAGDKLAYRTDQDAIRAMRAFDRQYRADYRRAATLQGAKAFDSLTLAEYLARYRNQVDAWFLEMLRVAYVGEMGVEADEQSALLFVTTLDPDTSQGFKLYGDSDQTLRIRNGNRRLIAALETWLTRQGVRIHLSTPLEAITATTDRVQLRFSGGDRATLLASRVICTLPFSVLRQVEGFAQLPLDPRKRACIQGMTYGTNAKFMQGYRARLWRQGASAGDVRVPPSNGLAYTNLFVQNLWETHFDLPAPLQNPKSGILTAFLGGRDGARLAHADRDKILAATDRIYPGTRALADASAVATFNWTRNPLSLGSYWSPRPGEITRFRAVVGLPDLDGKLLFAGEHTAPEFTGFMNGACLTGRLAAEAILKRPALKSA